METGKKSWLTQEEAARLLGVIDRTFRRYIGRYEENGEDGLLDKRLNQESHRQLLRHKAAIFTEAKPDSLFVLNPDNSIC